jgi:hypothetical protein
MDLEKTFRFTSVSRPVVPHEHTPPSNLLGPLGVLRGTWKGRGFNQIWRPFFVDPTAPPTVPPTPAGQDRFLELNETLETLTFEEIPGDVPNRGFLQSDINLHGLRYLQQVQDANALGPNGELAGIHVEHGMWLTVPTTTVPVDPTTVVRLATIPHGVSLAAQGAALPPHAGPPTFDPVSIAPFGIPPAVNTPLPPNNTITPTVFPERDLTIPTNFRTAASDIPNVTQDMVDNPNAFLSLGLQGKNVISTVTLAISTVSPSPAPNVPPPPPPANPQANPPVPGGQPTTGGGIANIAFLAGNPAPNALAARMDAVFWIETLEEPDGKIKHQLQYSQFVLLNFNGLSWPHVSVATLVKQEG